MPCSWNTCGGKTGKGEASETTGGVSWLASFPGWLNSSLTWSSPFLSLSTLLPGAPKIPCPPSSPKPAEIQGPGWLCILGCAYPGHECCLRVRVCALPEAYSLVFRCLRGWLACMLSAQGSLPWMSEAGRVISTEDPPSEMMYPRGAS